jgi:hypothetical protein
LIGFKVASDQALNDILARIDGVNDEEESGMAYPDEKPKDKWDKAEILAKILGAVLLPVITICIAYMLNASIQERSSRVRMVELAVEILKSDPKAATNANYMRGWAVEVLQKNSEVPLPEDALKSLMELPLPTNIRTQPLGSR